MRSKGDYEAFVEKFKPKLTTDDCYTPPAVYEAVKGWALETYPDWQGRPIVRPFYPGGDFERFDYPEGCVVIDNPPFSIYARIVRWYCERGIPFLLFAPGLTSVVVGADVTYVIADASIVYENGAVVRTNFVSNHPGEYRFFTAPGLREAIREAMVTARASKKLPSCKYSPHVTSSALLGKLACHGVRFSVRKEEAVYVRKSGGKALFGSGFLLCTSAARRAEEARRQAEEARRQAEEARQIEFPLSDFELELIKEMDRRA